MRRREKVKNDKARQGKKQGKKGKKNNKAKKTTLHVHQAFFYMSLPSLHGYHVKMPDFTFCEGRKQAMTKLYFSL